MTVLVTGASGYLGACVAQALVRRGLPVLGTSRTGRGVPSSVEGLALSLDDGGAAAAALLRERRPRAVIHLAALTRPDACDQSPAASDAVNRVATGAIAAAAAEVGARLLFASTDLVFAGDRAPYDEDAPPAPLGPYMQSKAAAERLVLQHAAHLVVRVPLLYGCSPSPAANFSGALLRRLRAGESVRLFSDQFRTPVEVHDGADLLCDLLETPAIGVVHLAGPERVSRHAHGLALARALGVSADLCLPVRAADLRLAPRPKDASLRSRRLEALTGRLPVGISEGWRRALASE